MEGGWRLLVRCSISALAGGCVVFFVLVPILVMGDNHLAGPCCRVQKKGSVALADFLAMMRHWEFWFAVIGASVASTLMYADLKGRLDLQQNDINYIKRDMAIMMERFDDPDFSTGGKRLGENSWPSLR